MVGRSHSRQRTGRWSRQADHSVSPSSHARLHVPAKLGRILPRSGPAMAHSGGVAALSCLRTASVPEVPNPCDVWFLINITLTMLLEYVRCHSREMSTDVMLLWIQEAREPEHSAAPAHG
jgi:hypothetical protein